VDPGTGVRVRRESEVVLGGFIHLLLNTSRAHKAGLLMLNGECNECIIVAVLWKENILLSGFLIFFLRPQMSFSLA